MEKALVTFTNEELNQLNALKETFKQCRTLGTVEEWNELREEAKVYYSQKIISALDASVFINEWMKGKV